MRTTICPSSTLVSAIVGALLAPAIAGAQFSPVAPSHTVRPGETLWNLASIYLGDGNRWPELVRANDSTFADPTRIPSGGKLLLPRNARRGAGKATVVANGGMVLAPSEESGVVDAPAKRTIFFGRNFRAVVHHAPPEAPLAPKASDSLIASRVWQSLAAPLLVADSEIADAPRLDQSLDVRVVGDGNAERQFMLHDRVRISGLGTLTIAVGARVTSFAVVRSMNGIGTLILPTGILGVDRLTSDGFAEARVLAVFDAMTSGQKVLPLDLLPAPSVSALPAPVTDGSVGRVLWVERDAGLPSLQHMVLVDIGAASKVRPGDQLTIFASGERSRVSLGSSTIEGGDILAVAVVVRATAHGATAMIIQQMQAGIREGSAVRVTAKLP